MEEKPGELSRRALLRAAGVLGLGALGGVGTAWPQEVAPPLKPITTFTGPDANPYWNSVGNYATYPQKDPLILLTDRPVQLETPREYFLTAVTPNKAFFVRWHLDKIPTGVNLSEWRLEVGGNVARPFRLSLLELLTRHQPVTLAAVNQCSGNSRSSFQPRVPGGQWGNGAMGNAIWTGVRLKDLLAAAEPKKGSVEVQLQGLESGSGPEGHGSHLFLKSLDLTNPVLDEAIVAYSMNGEPLPMLNGFPVRLIVPGYFATYWVKCLTWIRVLDKPDTNFWMNPAYRVPETPRGDTTPAAVKAGQVKMVPISRMPVRSFLISPGGSSKIPARLPVALRGIAFSGSGPVVKVEVSDNGGRSWREAKLGADLGAYSFRTWEHRWVPARPGTYSVAVRATDAKGNVQPDEGVWNPGGYLWNKIEKQELVVGPAE
jgi:DMSO/TMAO reductase YedYZ molybdopterin-dependent catalytic subunit